MDEKNRSVVREMQQKRFVTKTFYWAIIALFVYLLFKYCLPVWLPFVLGGIIASMLNRPINFLSSKTKIKRPYVCVVIVLLFFAAIGVLFGLVGTQAVQAVKNLAFALPSIYSESLQPLLSATASAVEQFAVHLSTISASVNDLSFLTQALNKGLSSASSALLSAVTGIASAVPNLFIKTIITIIATVFISLDYEKIRAFIIRQVPENRLAIVREMRSFFGVTLPKCIGAYILIMTLTFTELMVGFLIFRIPNAVLLALLIAIVDILPVLGTGTVLIPWAIIEFIIGDFTRGIEIAALYLIITVIRNSIEPKLVGSQIGLHPVVTFAGMLLGLNYMGLLGMFGVPLVTAFILDLNRKGIISIFKTE